ncbi:MAG: glycosyltransferase family 4 protein, partial [Planctomycetes bacterium]|nr:glycosyltransferase family 4 protein [Planctomycetota bacterium]
MPSPNILHLCSIKGRGGTGYMAGRLARLCADRGAKVMVGACPGSKIMERSQAAGLPILAGLRLRRGFRPWSLCNDIKRIRACIREEKINIIHAWHSIEYWTAALALMGMPENQIGLVRTRGLMTPVRAGYFNSFIHRRTAFVHVTCSRILELYREGGFEMKKVRLILDGVDTKKFHPRVSGSAVRKAAGIPSDAIILSSVGRLEKVKGHATLIAAVKLLA